LPCDQNFSVTSDTVGRPCPANLAPSRTVPAVQLPQWP
jgi:hypothetical protein